MFGPLGFPEVIFILVLALLIFGPKRLPEIGRTIGRGMAEFRKASNELKRTINTELAMDELPGKPLGSWAEPNYPVQAPAPAPAKAPEMTTARSPHGSLEAPAEPTPPTPPTPPIVATELDAWLEPEDEPSPAPAEEPLEPR
ncbi:MAG TPA: twin-arginine translocase TatA/TatE family subunit [Thermoanaerobaculia bacterium]|nr:twin-arginine translocase TatA/TatE family subunit [Thermoanaerobaculia bacterium]